MTKGAHLLACEQEMRAIIARGGRDPEVDHGDADAVLLRALRLLGYGTLCDLFDDVQKWYA